MSRIEKREFASRNGALSTELHDQLALLITTPLGTVVLDRDFGVDFACLDNPPPMAQSQLAGQLAEKIERYIPSLRLSEVQLQRIGADGKLYLKVVVDVESL